MSYKCFEMGANVITIKKDDKICAMTCAWASMVGYDLVVLLLGDTSDTGSQIQIGDIIGVSALASDQKHISTRFGEGHSLIDDKARGFEFDELSGALVVPGAKTKNAVKVLRFIKEPELGEDYFVFGKIIEYKEDGEKDFLRLVNA